MASFELAVTITLQHEGGLVDDPHDPGGITKYGISKHAYPKLDIKGLTVDDAKAIYRRDYWQYGGIADQSIANKVFDMAVLTSPRNANKLLQLACGACGHNVKPDGCLGPMSLSAINAIPPYELLTTYKAELTQHFGDLIEKNPNLKRYQQGWENRVRS